MNRALEDFDATKTGSVVDFLRTWPKGTNSYPECSRKAKIQDVDLIWRVELTGLRLARTQSELDTTIS